MRDSVKLAIACICGIVVGQIFHSRSDTASEEDMRAIKARLEEISKSLYEPVGRVNCTAIVDPDVIKSELKRVVEMSGVRGFSDKEPGPQLPPLPLPPAPSREALVALDRGRELVAQAKSRGSWGDEQAISFRTCLSQLDKSAQDELLRDLVPAINDGRVKIETSGPPF